MSQHAITVQVAIYVFLSLVALAAGNARAEATTESNQATLAESTAEPHYSPAQIRGLAGFSGDLQYSGGNVSQRQTNEGNFRQEDYLKHLQIDAFYGLNANPDWQGVVGLSGILSGDQNTAYDDNFGKVYEGTQSASMALAQASLTWRNTLTVGVLYNSFNTSVPVASMGTDIYTAMAHSHLNLWTFGASVHNQAGELGLSYSANARQDITAAATGMMSGDTVPLTTTEAEPGNMTLYGKTSLTDSWKLLGAVRYTIYDQSSQLSPLEQSSLAKSSLRVGPEVTVNQQFLVGFGLRYTGAAYLDPAAYADSLVPSGIATYGVDVYEAYSWRKDYALSLRGNYNYGVRSVTNSSMGIDFDPADSYKDVVQSYYIGLTLSHDF